MWAEGRWFCGEFIFFRVAPGWPRGCEAIREASRRRGKVFPEHVTGSGSDVERAQAEANVSRVHPNQAYSMPQLEFGRSCCLRAADSIVSNLTSYFISQHFVLLASVLLYTRRRSMLLALCKLDLSAAL